jgi:hypothetical protein
MTIPATDGERNYTLPLATGDKVRLFASTPARIRGKGAGNIGRNGSILDVVAADKHGITLKSRTGSIGLVAWATLQTKGRAKLAYGDAMTIHTAQGTTSREPILALPSGSSAIDGKLGYSGNTRHRHVSYLLTNEVAEGMDVRKRRALNDAREITISDRWANVARALSYQPEKDTAVALFDRIGSIRRGSAREFQKFIPNASKATEASAQHAPELARRRSIDRALYQARVMIRQVVDHVRQVPAHVAARITRRHEHTRHHGRSLGR